MIGLLEQQRQQAVLVMPICLIERIHYLRYISILSLLLVSYAMCIIVFHFAELIYQNKRLDFDPPALPVIRAFNWSSSIFVAIPIVAFCFVFRAYTKPLTGSLTHARYADIVSEWTDGWMVGWLRHVGLPDLQ